jgi:peptidoglycan hydrolase CwlO-like protein
MASVAELQAALDRNTAATTAAGQAITAEITQLQDAIGQLSTSQPPTQAQIDQLNASSTALEAATASLVADDPTQVSATDGGAATSTT